MVNQKACGDPLLRRTLQNFIETKFPLRRIIQHKFMFNIWGMQYNIFGIIYMSYFDGRRRNLQFG